MSYRMHRAATLEYAGAVQWMKEHHYDPRALGRFIYEIESALIAIESSPESHPEDSSGRLGLRCYGPTESYRYSIRYWLDIGGMPVIVAISAPQRRPGYWKNRRP